MIKFKDTVYDLESDLERKMLEKDTGEIEFEIDTGDTGLDDYDDVLAWIEKVHELISAKDEKGLSATLNDFEGGSDYFFEIVQESQMLADALKSNGYTVSESMASRSVYTTNDKGEEVRIADHKRPPIVDGFTAHEHDYDNEIIIDDVAVSSKELAAVGVKLPEGTYYLN